jgi:hypothetical protein
VDRCNEQEAETQRLAAANVRQTNTIQKLREELLALRTKDLPPLSSAGEGAEGSAGVEGVDW